MGLSVVLIDISRVDKHTLFLLFVDHAVYIKASSDHLVFSKQSKDGEDISR